MSAKSGTPQTQSAVFAEIRETLRGLTVEEKKKAVEDLIAKSFVEAKKELGTRANNPMIKGLLRQRLEAQLLPQILSEEDRAACGYTS